MLSVIYDFGAIGDGLANDTAAFQAAINSGEEVYIDKPSVGYKITSPLIINNRVSLVGTKNKANILPTFSDYLFKIKSSDVSISGLKITAIAGNSTSLIVLDTASLSMERIRIENVDGWNLLHGIVDTGGSNIIVTLNIKDIMLRLHLGRGFYLTKVFAFLFMENLTIDSVSVNNNIPKGVIVGNEGAYLNRVFMLGSTPSNSSQYGFYFQNCKALHLNQTHVDTLGGIGYYFNNCQYIQADHITSSLGNQHGLFMYHTKIAQFTNVYVGGRSGLSPALASCNGIFLDVGCDRINISNYISRLNTGAQFYSNPANTNIVTIGGIAV